jgi:hypothetical protein
LNQGRENSLKEEEPGESWAEAVSVATHVAQREGGELGEAGAILAVRDWVQPVVREDRAIQEYEFTLVYFSGRIPFGSTRGGTVPRMRRGQHPKTTERKWRQG